MTLLVVGVSHRTAPVTLLDRVALVDGAAERLQVDLLASAHVAESLVLSTCNRVEVYAEVSKFHGGVARRDRDARQGHRRRPRRAHPAPLRPLRGPRRAAPVRGRVRPRLDGGRRAADPRPGPRRTAHRRRTARPIGRSLNDLAQAALRVGKRVHHDTGIDRAGASVVSVALDLAADSARRQPRRQASPRGRRGCDERPRRGHAAARRASARSSWPTAPSSAAQHLAEPGGRPGGRASTRSVGHARRRRRRRLLHRVHGPRAHHGRRRDRARPVRPRPLAVVDLALPHDTEESIASLPGVSRIDLAVARRRPRGARARARRRARPRDRGGRGARAPRGHRRAAGRADRRRLRSHADQVVEAELAPAAPASCPASTRRELDEVAARHAPRGVDAAAPADGAHEGARRRPGRRPLRHRAAPPVRPRPRGDRRRHRGRRSRAGDVVVRDRGRPRRSTTCSAGDS